MTARSLPRLLFLHLLFLLLGALFRFPYLSALPSPCGDEGNWTQLGLAFSRGIPARLATDASTVTTLFAHLLSWSFSLFGPTFFSARLPLVCSVLFTAVCSAWLLQRQSLPRAALALNAALCLHPWSVAWSRTASVPYVLALCLSVLAPLLALSALRSEKKGIFLLFVFLATQCAFLGFHFTPLAALSTASVLLLLFAYPWMAPSREEPVKILSFRFLSTVAATLVASLHLAFVLPGVRAAARVTTVDPNPFRDLSTRLSLFSRSIANMFSGQSTVLHFTPYGPPGHRWGELLLGSLTFAIVLGGLWKTRETLLARISAVQLSIVLVGLPVLLLRGRDWYLPTIDADRYAFVFVAPLLLCTAVFAEHASSRVRSLAVGMLLFWTLGGTAPLAHFYLYGGGPDQGLYLKHNGRGYRGFRPAHRSEPLPELIAASIQEFSHGAPATLLYRDYAFHPMVFLVSRDVSHRLQVARTPRIPSTAHTFALVWHPSIFTPDFVPGSAREENAHFREEARSHGTLLRTFTQPDGSPLCELFRFRN